MRGQNQFFKPFFGVLIGLLLLISCSTPEISPEVCLSGDCQVEFVIDTLGRPGTYKDSQGVWHIKHNGLNYFTVKGKVGELHPHYVINRVPLIVVGFDSNMFYLPGNIIVQYSTYSYLGLWNSNQMNTPIPVGIQTYTFPQLVRNYSVMNLAGYTIQKNPNVDVNHPAYKTYFATYSKYTYTPQQSMVFFKDFIGKQATLYIKTSLGEGRKEIYKELKVVFEE